MGRSRRTIRRLPCAATMAATRIRRAPEHRSSSQLRSRSGCFFRFATTDIHPASREPRGVFRAAGLLFHREDVTDFDRHRLDDLFDWFQAHLPVPRRKDLTPATIFWFRPDASTCASRIWELVHLLREYGVAVRTVRTRRPGRIVYSDRMQVGAEPHRDTRCDAVRTVL